MPDQGQAERSWALSVVLTPRPSRSPRSEASRSLLPVAQSLWVGRWMAVACHLATHSHFCNDLRLPLSLACQPVTIKILISK